MANEKAIRRHSRSAVRRAWLYCLLMALPTFLFAGILVFRAQISTAPIILIACCLLLYLSLIAGALIDSLVRPLQTLSNVVASLREGDYSFRARGASAHDPLGELASEINALADLLQKQRVRSLEATALLARILEVMVAPLFAFDRDNVLQLVNAAGTDLLQRPYARSFGHSAGELGLDVLLAAPDQSIHSFGGKPARWLLRKATFRQDGRTRCCCSPMSAFHYRKRSRPRGSASFASSATSFRIRSRPSSPSPEACWRGSMPWTARKTPCAIFAAASGL